MSQTICCELRVELNRKTEKKKTMSVCGHLSPFILRRVAADIGQEVGYTMDKSPLLWHKILRMKQCGLVMMQRLKALYHPDSEKHLYAEHMSVSHDRELQWGLLRHADVSCTSLYGIGCYIKLHVEIWRFDFIFLVIKWLNVKNDERHLHIWGSTLHYHANPLSATLFNTYIGLSQTQCWRLWLENVDACRQCFRCNSIFIVCKFFRITRFLFYDVGSQCVSIQCM